MGGKETLRHVGRWETTYLTYAEVSNDGRNAVQAYMTYDYSHQATTTVGNRGHGGL